MKAKGVPRERLLGSTKAVARDLGVECRNPKWTSYGALELDVFCPTKGDFRLFIEATRPLAVPEFTRDLGETPEYKPEGELISEARFLFNAERYWECHEVLEGIWRTKQGREKLLLQGIILVCAGYVHHQKGEDDVALGVLSRAERQLEYSAAEYAGINIGELRAGVGAVLESRRFTSLRV